MPLLGEAVLLLVLLVVLHVAFAAVWFGNRLGLPADMRETIHAMEEPEQGLVRRIRRSAGLDRTGMAGVLVTGGLLIYRIGPAEVDVTTWAGAATALAMIGVTFLLTRPARKELRSALLAGQRPEAVAAAKRVTGALNLEAFLWVIALVLMLI